MAEHERLGPQPDGSLMASNLKSASRAGFQRGEWDGVKKVFLRNIPAKCSREILLKFFDAQVGDADIKLWLPQHANGKCRGYAHVFLTSPEDATRFVRAIENQQIPGFHKEGLKCEPLWNTEEHEVYSPFEVQGDHSKVATLSRLLKQFGLPERSGWDRTDLSRAEDLSRSALEFTL
ncbi:unnamed protein product [Effrenium voratum]|nr:unnamed protein product [Effrenium voratum]